MALPAAQLLNLEVLMQGNVIAGGSNSRAYNMVYHYRRTTTSVPPSKANFLAAFVAATRLAILSASNVRLVLTGYQARWLNDATDPYVPLSDVHIGLVTGDSLPTDNAVFLLFRTGIRGKSYRGCKHFFPIAESHTTTGSDDILNAGAITLWTAVATALLGTITDSDGNVWVPSVFSRKLSQVKMNPTTVVANDVTAVLLNKRIGSMRHRKVKSAY
jgi:hypothetical protein